MRPGKHAPRPSRVRQIWRAFFIGLALIGMTTSFAAAAPLTGTYTGRIIGRQITFDRKGKSVTDWAGVLNLRLDDGQNVPTFCVEVDVLVRPGDRYRSDGPVLALRNGCKIRYLLDKYPASSARTADEAAARQMAIWAFSDDVDPTTIISATVGVRNRAIALVNEAKRAPCPAPQPGIPSLTLEPPTANAAAGQTINYTVRAGPEGAGKSVTLAVSGPAVLANGQQQMSVPLDGQGNATFGVTSTGAGATTVSARLPYVLGAGTVFMPLDPANKTQLLVTAEKVARSATASSQVNWASGPTETPRPRPREHPTETATPAGQATPTPEVVTEQATPTPEVAATEQATSTPQATAPQAAGGAGRPRSLPNTGAPSRTPIWPLAGLAALVCAGGWLLRRRSGR